MRRLLLSLALLLTIGAGCASAQVVFDANATADCVSSAINLATGKTCATLTVGAGSNRAVVCAVDLSLKTPTTEAMVWDSGGTNQSMTQIIAANGTGTISRAELWGLVAPTSGAKTVKYTAASATSDVVINCTSYTGVDQTGGATSFPHSASATGTETTNGTGKGALTVTSATNDAVVWITNADSASWATPTQTATFTDNTPASISTAGQRAAGAATVAGSWTLSGVATAHWVTVGTDILAAGGGGGCTAPPNQLLMLGVGSCHGDEDRR